MVPDQSALITVADEQRGHLPKWGRTHDSDVGRRTTSQRVPWSTTTTTDWTQTRLVDMSNSVLRQKCQR
eukprot:3097193-Pyramimonas_sp.AAC.1